MVRFDFACKKCEKTFTVWSDDARVCAYCGSKKVFKVFLSPPAISTGQVSRIETLAEKQLEAAGLSNYTNAGGSIRRTRKTDPKMLEAVAAAKANNIPFQIQTGPNGTIQSQAGTAANLPVPLARTIASRGKAEATYQPKGTGALVSTLMQRARVAANPLHGPVRLPKDGGKDDGAKLKAMMGK